MLTRSTGENSVSAYSYSQTIMSPDEGPSHTTDAESPLSHLAGCLKNTQLYEGLGQTEIFNKVCHAPSSTIQMALSDPFIFVP